MNDRHTATVGKGVGGGSSTSEKDKDQSESNKKKISSSSNVLPKAAEKSKRSGSSSNSKDNDKLTDDKSEGKQKEGKGVSSSRTNSNKKEEEDGQVKNKKDKHKGRNNRGRYHSEDDDDDEFMTASSNRGSSSIHHDDDNIGVSRKLDPDETADMFRRATLVNVDTELGNHGAGARVVMPTVKGDSSAFYVIITLLLLIGGIIYYLNMSNDQNRRRHGHMRHRGGHRKNAWLDFVLNLGQYALEVFSRYPATLTISSQADSTVTNTFITTTATEETHTSSPHSSLDNNSGSNRPSQTRKKNPPHPSVSSNNTSPRTSNRGSSTNTSNNHNNSDHRSAESPRGKGFLSAVSGMCQVCVDQVLEFITECQQGFRDAYNDIFNITHDSTSSSTVTAAMNTSGRSGSATTAAAATAVIGASTKSSTGSHRDKRDVRDKYNASTSSAVAVMESGSHSHTADGNTSGQSSGNTSVSSSSLSHPAVKKTTIPTSANVSTTQSSAATAVTTDSKLKRVLPVLTSTSLKEKSTSNVSHRSQTTRTPSAAATVNDNYYSMQLSDEELRNLTEEEAILRAIVASTATANANAIAVTAHNTNTNNTSTTNTNANISNNNSTNATFTVINKKATKLKKPTTTTATTATSTTTSIVSTTSAVNYKPQTLANHSPPQVQINGFNHLDHRTTSTNTTTVVNNGMPPKFSLEEVTHRANKDYSYTQRAALVSGTSNTTTTGRMTATTTLTNKTGSIASANTATTNGPQVNVWKQAVLPHKKPTSNSNGVNESNLPHSTSTPALSDTNSYGDNNNNAYNQTNSYRKQEVVNTASANTTDPTTHSSPNSMYGQYGYGTELDILNFSNTNPNAGDRTIDSANEPDTEGQQGSLYFTHSAYPLNHDRQQTAAAAFDSMLSSRDSRVTSGVDDGDVSGTTGQQHSLNTYQQSLQHKYHIQGTDSYQRMTNHSHSSHLWDEQQQQQFQQSQSLESDADLDLNEIGFGVGLGLGLNMELGLDSCFDIDQLLVSSSSSPVPTPSQDSRSHTNNLVDRDEGAATVNGSWAHAAVPPSRGTNSYSYDHHHAVMTGTRDDYIGINSHMTSINGNGKGDHSALDKIKKSAKSSATTDDDDDDFDLSDMIMQHSLLSAQAPSFSPAGHHMSYLSNTSANANASTMSTPPQAQGQGSSTDSMSYHPYNQSLSALSSHLHPLQSQSQSMSEYTDVLESPILLDTMDSNDLTVGLMQQQQQTLLQEQITLLLTCDCNAVPLADIQTVKVS